MAPYQAKFQLQDLKKYRGPGLFFGGGFLAGLLLFLVWLAFLPSADQALLASQPAATASAAQKPLPADEGILSGITGDPEAGQRIVAVDQGDDAEVSADGAGADEVVDAAIAEPGDGSEVNAPQVISDEQAIADGLLNAPSQVRAGAMPEPELQTYYVEVMRGPGVSEIVEVNAESAEHARSIIRDYRGNPRIIHGPSTRPLN